MDRNLNLRVVKALSVRCANRLTACVSSDKVNIGHRNRDAYIAGATSSGRLNIALWHLIFVGPSFETSCTSNFEVACTRVSQMKTLNL